MHAVIFTTMISEEVSHAAYVQGIRIMCIPFLETAFLPSATWNIPQDGLPWIFTSKVAVNALKAHPGFSPEQFPETVYAVGEATATLLKEYGCKKVINGHKGGELLASLITAPEVHFFCGDQRREEMVQALREKGTLLHETTVYTSLPHIPELPLPAADAIVFMSPLAVQTFSEIIHARDFPVFAIGETTEKTLKDFHFHHIHTAATPSVNAVLSLIYNYFQHASTKK